MLWLKDALKEFCMKSIRFNHAALRLAMMGGVALTQLTLPQVSQAADTTTTNNNSTVTAAPAQGQLIDGVIAVVNDNAILNSELEQAVAQAVAQLRASKQPVPPAQQMYSQVLNQMITRQLQLDLVKRQGIKADDNQVNNALSNIAKQNGAASLADFQQKVDKTRPGTYQALRQQISDDLAIQALQQQQMARRVRITDQDVDMFLRSPESNALDESQYRTLHVRVPYSSSTATGAITDKQKQQALNIARQIADGLRADNADLNSVIEKAQLNYAPQIQGGDMGFHVAKDLPTEISKDITALQVGQVSQPLVTPEGVNVIKLIDKKGGGQQVIDQWSTRHILISPSPSLSPEMAKQQIDSIYQQLQQGADFATLAATYSKDGSAANGGSLGWVTEGEMVPQFEAVMKNTPVNDFSTPFQTQFGWHILKVDAQRKQDVTDTYRRNMARELLYQRMAPQALEDWLQELRAQAYIKINQ